jgi:hypothetical protein
MISCSADDRTLERAKTGTASAERRVALVIGNNRYQHTAPLANTRSDATAMGKALQRLGFDVDLQLNLTRTAMDTALRRFGDRLEDAQVGLFYYAGHGMQVNGTNYLVPVDARLLKGRDLNYEVVALSKVLQEMEAEPRVNLVFLDACRDNPLARTLARGPGASRSVVGQGLAPVNAATGTLISYATKDGAVAADGEGEHSPYTQALLKHLETPGLEVGLMLRQVRKDVMQATGEKQVPWEYASLLEAFYLLPADRPDVAQDKPQAPSTDTKVDPLAVELTFWEGIKNSNDAELFREYLVQYPQGRFAKIAEVRLRELESSLRPEPAKRNQYSASPEPMQGSFGWLGIEPWPLSNGVRVFRIAENGPAHRAGIRAGDIIKSYSGRAVNPGLIGVEDLVKGILETRPGSVVSIQILRDGDKQTLSVPVSSLEKAAEQSDPDGQFALGLMYANGWGVVKDEAEAVKWFRKAAEQGHPSGQFALGRMYADSRGVDKNEAEAVKWYRRAAEQDHLGGQVSLGLMYANGWGVIKDEAEAVKWYREAAEQGEPSGQVSLGLMYETGRGVENDYKQAVKWYRKAAEQGHVKAQAMLDKLGSKQRRISRPVYVPPARISEQ